MSIKDTLLNPYVVLGAASASYYGHTKYGKKHGYMAPAVGAVAGGLAGLLLKKWLAPQPQQAQLPVNAQQQQPQEQAQDGYGEYVDLDDPRPAPGPRPTPAAPTQTRSDWEAERAATMNLGSLSNGDGLGSLAVDDAFNADEIDYSDLIGGRNDDDGYHGNGVN